MKFFLPLERVDAEQRMVWGYGSTEALCGDGLVVRNEAVRDALPDYMKFANIREMHQPSAVGVARSAEVDGKGIYLGAHIVDDGAWKKVEAGVYKGFSIGAKIERREGNAVTGLKILEFSLCDRPENPETVFDIYRAAGIDDPAKAVDPEAAISALTDAVERAEKGADKAKEPYGDVDYADPGYQKDKKKRYPLDTEEHIRAGWNYIHKKKNAGKYTAEQVANIEAKIATAWKEKIDKAGPPAAKEKDKTKRTADLKRGLDTTARLLQITQDLAWLQECVAIESAIEGDDSPIVGQTKEQVGALLVLAKQMLDEEAEELMTENDDTDVVMAAAQGIDLARVADYLGAKAPKLAEMLTRAGARHSKADKDRVQKMHDMAVELGADCPADGAERGVSGADLQRLADTVNARDETIARMAGVMTDMADRVKRIEAQPMPGGPILRSVSRESDGAVPPASQGQVDEFLTRFGAMTPEQRAFELTKLALRNPTIIKTERN